MHFKSFFKKFSLQYLLIHLDEFRSQVYLSLLIKKTVKLKQNLANPYNFKQNSSSINHKFMLVATLKVINLY